MSNSIPRVSLLGNIAVGKSSVAKLVTYNNPKGVPVYEPLEECRKTGLFESFYKDKKKFSLEWQKLVVSRRSSDVQEASSNKTDDQILLVDGHMLTDRHVFVETLVEEGSMTLEEKRQYEEFYDKHVPTHENEVLIYLRCSPESSLARASFRNRAEEKGIPLEYLQRLNKHLDVFVSREDVRDKVFVVEVSSMPLGEVVAIVSRIVDSVYTSRGIPEDLPRYYTNAPQGCSISVSAGAEMTLIVQ